MKFSALTQRLGNDAASAWRVHFLATQRQAAGEKIIMLSIGEEKGARAAQAITDAAINSLNDGRQHYSEVRGSQALRQKIAAYHESLTGQQVSEDQCTVYAGAQSSLFALAQCLLEHGDEVILPEPYYTTYPGVFGATGATLVRVAGDPESFFLPPVNAIQNALTPSTRMVVITQPGNPMGSYYQPEEIRQLVALSREHGFWLVSDEVYSALLPESARYSPASVAEPSDCIATVNSLSKSHRMTGWRLGWAVTPPALAENLVELSMVMTYGLPQFIMDAGIVALSDEGEAAAGIRASMQERRDICREHLEGIKNVRLLDSGVGMFVVLDVSDTGSNADQFAEQLLAEEAVATLPCNGFGNNCDTLVRIGLCVEAEELAEAAQRIARFANQRF